ncbi:CGNR zinc finger domain-containing protein [Streptomyces johnsoniae]|uniref:CGNR zinc finger domain-containing protein n=1 Tax=Streptomyces johnsoniae TaxID=3075532 RepID=A0ABU2S3A8_9ACTN|nr:CGNR zinc finger domain-containing protein [Streptomyces sp. DSM 41886]MDT0443392.1 CGNR zinc finger domain-containing protein [Streptomyces sp. DSM 41886]
MASRATSPGLVLRSFSGTTYRFDPGALCLELLVTGGPGAFARYEVLHGPADLADWAARSRLDPTPRVEVSEEETAAARRTRDALWRLVLAHVGGEPPPPDDVAALNAAAARTPLAPAIGADGGPAWAGAATGTALLATVARDAVRLLTGPHRDRVRMCAGERCHLVYVDTSRPGRRRWCSMEHCGNIHKVRALRARGESG